MKMIYLRDNRDRVIVVNVEQIVTMRPARAGNARSYLRVTSGPALWIAEDLQEIENIITGKGDPR